MHGATAVSFTSVIDLFYLYSQHAVHHWNTLPQTVNSGYFRRNVQAAAPQIHVYPIWASKASPNKPTDVKLQLKLWTGARNLKLMITSHLIANTSALVWCVHLNQLMHFGPGLGQTTVRLLDLQNPPLAGL